VAGEPVKGSGMSSERERIGEVLAGIRQSAGLTQTQLAEALGTDRFRLGRYERGVRVPDVVMLIKILDALGTSLAGFQAKLEGGGKESSRLMEALARELRELGSPRLGPRGDASP